jgi:F-type H+-transporting ATPase subunit b
MPLNIDFQQIFLHLLNFTLLFAILYYLLYSPVKNFMAKRDEYYANMDK